MERKIGEIFEYNGEWLQCVEQPKKYDKTVCAICAFQGNGNCELDRCSGTYRSDKKSVIFKKLEKVGESFSDEHFGLVQKYELKMYDYSTKDKRVCVADGYDVFIKLKQSKEDIRPYDELFSPGTASNTKYLAKEDMEDLDKIEVRDYTKVEELNVMEENKLNLKPFDIQKAREGKPVCTRDGRKARIICFDRRGDKFPIVALLDGCNEEHSEVAETFTNEGLYEIGEKSSNDLMMLPEKKEGWVNVYKERIYSTKEEAIEATYDGVTYVDTVKVCWEE